MTSAIKSGLTKAPTVNPRLLAWVAEIAELTIAADIYWCDGTHQEWNRPTLGLVSSGTPVRLNDVKKPNSFWREPTRRMSPESSRARSSAPRTPMTPGLPTGWPQPGPSSS